MLNFQNETHVVNLAPACNENPKICENQDAVTAQLTSVFVIDTQIV